MLAGNINLPLGVNSKYYQNLTLAVLEIKTQNKKFSVKSGRGRPFGARNGRSEGGQRRLRSRKQRNPVLLRRGPCRRRGKAEARDDATLAALPGGVVATNGGQRTLGRVMTAARHRPPRRSLVGVVG